MKNSNLLDMTRPDRLEIHNEFENYRLNWQQILLVTANPKAPTKETLVLTNCGCLLQVRTPLRVMIKEFANQQRLDDNRNRAYYQVCSLEHQTRSAVAGRYRMVPTCSPRNDQVCWVMAHNLDSWHKHARGTLLIFASEEQPNHQLQVLVDASAQKLKTNLTAADVVSAFQLRMMDYDLFLMGSSVTTLKADEFGKLSMLRQQRDAFECIYEQRVFDYYYRSAYGEGLAEELVQGIHSFVTFSP